MFSESRSIFLLFGWFALIHSRSNSVPHLLICSDSKCANSGSALRTAASSLNSEISRSKWASLPRNSTTSSGGIYRNQVRLRFSYFKNCLLKFMLILWYWVMEFRQLVSLSSAFMISSRHSAIWKLTNLTKMWF